VKEEPTRRRARTGKLPLVLVEESIAPFSKAGRWRMPSQRSGGLESIERELGEAGGHRSRLLEHLPVAAARVVSARSRQPAQRAGPRPRARSNFRPGGAAAGGSSTEMSRRAAVGGSSGTRSRASSGGNAPASSWHECRARSRGRRSSSSRIVGRDGSYAPRRRKEAVVHQRREVAPSRTVQTVASGAFSLDVDRGARKSFQRAGRG